MRFARTLAVVIRERHRIVSSEAPPAYENVTRKAKVSITELGIAVEGESPIRREDIAQAFIQPRSGQKSTVRVFDHRHNVVFETELTDPAEGREILRALGHDVTQTRTSFAMASPLFDSALRMIAAFGLFAFALYEVVNASARAPIWQMFGVMALFLMLASRRTIDVGVDGVFITWLGRKRFIAHREIASITNENERVRLELKNGQRVQLAMPLLGSNRHQMALERAALHARIEEARAAAARPHDELAELVRCGPRNVAEWRAALEQLRGAAGPGGYRDAAPRGEDLWRVVEDPSAPEDARAAAAVVLRKEEGAAPRLRVAVEAVASPKLRVALEKAADPDTEDDALDSVLEQFVPRR